MPYLSRNYLMFPFLLVFAVACSGPQTIYGDFESNEDGLISAAIPNDSKEPLLPEPSRNADELSEKELELVEKWHEGDVDKLSFIVVDAEKKKVLRRYFSETPQRLASVSKISTALGALENVNGPSVSKIKKMLKTSHNGEASRYVRLAAKAIDSLELETKHYSEAHSCPNEFLNDEPAAIVNFEWLKSELPNVDWAGASLYDGAGCHYDNFMSPLQTAKIIEYADSMGKAYGGLNFEDLLSINGKDGTWKNKNSEHKGYIFAKTGTLNPNGNLAGYFYARRKGKLHKYYFTIFVQKKGAGKYSTNARKMMEGLMRYWINYYSSNEGLPLQDF